MPLLWMYMCAKPRCKVWVLNAPQGKTLFVYVPVCVCYLSFHSSTPPSYEPSTCGHQPTAWGDVHIFIFLRQWAESFPLTQTSPSLLTTELLITTSAGKLQPISQTLSHSFEKTRSRRLIEWDYWEAFIELLYIFVMLLFCLEHVLGDWRLNGRQMHSHVVHSSRCCCPRINISSRKPRFQVKSATLKLESTPAASLNFFLFFFDVLPKAYPTKEK